MHAWMIVAALAWQGAPKDAEKPSLKPLREVARQLEKGVAPFLEGRDLSVVAEAFKPWAFDAADPSGRLEKTLKDLEDARAVKARCFALEIGTTFMNEGQPLLSVQALVLAAGDAEPRILAIRKGHGRAGVPKASCTGPAAPFGQAAEAFEKLLRAGKAEALPFVPEEELPKLSVPEALREAMGREIKRFREGSQKIAEEVRDLKYDDVHVTGEEQWFTLHKQDGSVVNEGLLRGKYKVTDKGAVEYRLSRLERH
jgi:hypothetical protein